MLNIHQRKTSNDETPKQEVIVLVRIYKKVSFSFQFCFTLRESFPLFVLSIVFSSAIFSSATLFYSVSIRLLCNAWLHPNAHLTTETGGMKLLKKEQEEKNKLCSTLIPKRTSKIRCQGGLVEHVRIDGFLEDWRLLCNF
ncbi:hypothetical protein TNCT_192051 [Trichonephila clavata]|uniref:Transmembrane protein n=1 Tax=Trichonephila clavata TaxID=2740835 RepID=A0A8X6GH33_TRICU|nr:hypothetical protein TNCT_192051 [Trichonephila clavata]